MNKAIFLDRDGTINIDKNYIGRKEDFFFLPKVFDAIKIFKELGFYVFIITNQSGIARGFYTESEYLKLNEWMMEQFKKNGVYIDAVYYCPHHPSAAIEKYKITCNCRKPKLGLYIKAIADYDIDVDKSFAVGDKIRDCAICENTECKGFLIGNNEDRLIINGVKAGQYKNVQYLHDLYEVATYLERLKD